MILGFGVCLCTVLLFYSPLHGHQLPSNADTTKLPAAPFIDKYNEDSATDESVGDAPQGRVPPATNSNHSCISEPVALFNEAASRNYFLC